jgi:nitrate/TMAO reductase-like tetraheme cytochrome c subunit
MKASAPGTGLGMVGAALAVASAVLIVGLAVAGLFGYGGSPYVGIFAYLVLPGVFVLGLLLIPLGAWLERRRSARGEAHRLPIVDLNDPRTRRRGVVFAALTAVNLLIVGFATYEGVHVMETPQFCGSCHSVMAPEYTAYQRSPHARVACVECHIGPGASWFVKSKLSGAWQVVSVTLDLYERPIPTPVHALRPARETCEACHWPAKFHGDRLDVRTVFAADERNTEKKTVLLLHVGGAEHEVGPPRGIHAHVAPGVTVRYLSDPERETIHTVESTYPDGRVSLFTTSASPAEPPPPAAWRTMDCVDCHNRASHRFRLPGPEVDLALASGRIDRTLPFVKREAVAALKVEYPSHEAARAGLEAALLDFYRGLDPATFPAREPKVREAAAALAQIYAWNVWPSMRIGWGTYASLRGHEDAPGCFRCHDEEHVTADGRTLSQDCDLCHAVLAQEEENPKVLGALEP